MTTRIQLRRDSASNWAANNPILLSGELGIESDTNRFKIGTGVRWNATTSYGFSVGLPNGVASLDSTGKIPTSQMPDQVSVSQEVANALAAISTSNIPEGGNQYFTNARAISALASTIASALTTAANDATSKSSAAQSAAISAAATDATTKSGNAQSAAISAAATDATTKSNAAQTAATNASATYTDAKVATEVTNRNSAISSAIATEVTNRNAAITTAVSGISGGSTSLSSKTTDDLAEGTNHLYYTDAKVNTLVNPKITDVLIAVNGSIDDLSSSISSTYVTKTDADSKYVAKTGLQNSLDLYVLESGRNAAFGYAGLDANGLLSISEIPTSIARTSDITSAISSEVTSRNSAISTAINNLINSAPGTLDTLGEIATALQNDQTAVAGLTSAIALKAPLASPTFTGTVSGITKAMVGLSNVDNTTDTNKPLSTATISALALKAPLASPTFTGTVDFSGATVNGLPSVDLSAYSTSTQIASAYLTQANASTTYLTQANASTTYATISNAQTYGYHNSSSGSTANKIAYGTSGTPTIGSPVAGDIYIQY
jgi:hypothetical protein